MPMGYVKSPPSRVANHWLPEQRLPLADPWRLLCMCCTYLQGHRASCVLQSVSSARSTASRENDFVFKAAAGGHSNGNSAFQVRDVLDCAPSARHADTLLAILHGKLNVCSIL